LRNPFFVRISDWKPPVVRLFDRIIFYGPDSRLALNTNTAYMMVRKKYGSKTNYIITSNN